MNKSKYHRYLCSREWAVLKQQVKERSKGKCERCGFGEFSQVHHLTYERQGCERLDDLWGVCEDCHEFLSGKTDHDPMIPKPNHIEPLHSFELRVTAEKLTEQIREAEANHDERKLNKLLRRKSQINKIQAQNTNFRASL